MTSTWTSHDGRALRVRLGGEARPTVLDRATLALLSDALDSGESDERVRALVIEGQERWFCAGADLSQYLEGTDLSARDYLSDLQALFRRFWRSPLVIITAVRGLALGGGAELALWSDLRLCAADCSWGFPEAGIGSVAGAGGVQLLPRLLGVSVAAGLLLTGRRIRGTRAHELGLVQWVAESDKLASTLESLVEDVTRMSPVGLATSKRLLHDGLESSLEASLAAGLEASHLAFFRGDAVEGIRAFFDRRPTSFEQFETTLFPST